MAIIKHLHIYIYNTLSIYHISNKHTFLVYFDCCLSVGLSDISFSNYYISEKNCFIEHVAFNEACIRICKYCEIFFSMYTFIFEK